MNILIGGLLQESNTFSEARSSIEDFRSYYYRTGDEMLAPQRTENELSGFLRGIRERPEAKPQPTLYAQAVSSGKLPRQVLKELKRQLREQIGRAPVCDGVLFAMHGAWVAEDCDDADGEVLTELRQLVGPDVPIVITLDSHANVTQRMVAAVDGIVGYRTFPHIDFADRGYQAAQLLFGILRTGRRPHIALRKVPMIVPAERHETYRGPMGELWAEALAGERNGQAGLTSLFLVQPWLDIEEMGSSVVVVDEDAAKAEREADRLAGLMWAKRKEFAIRLYTVDEVLQAMAAEPERKQVVVVSDSADSPGAGSAGDSNAVLRELLRLGADRGVRCLLSMVDREAVATAVAAGAGAKVRLEVGYSLSRSVGSPLAIEATVAALGDGRFVFGGGTVANLVANMGRCAVVTIGTLSVLLMENPTFTGDPAMYRSVGLEPTEADLVLVKSATQFRAEYEQLTDRIYILDTPGASTANLHSLRFTRIPRPMYPFDDDFR